jgi:hypothetical protein
MDELWIVLVLRGHIDLLGHALGNALTAVFTPHD